MAQTEVYGVITQVERVGGSRNGNPTYRIHLATGDSYVTQTDGSVGYSAPNYERHSSEKADRTNTLIVERNRVVAIKGPNRWDALHGSK